MTEPACPVCATPHAPEATACDFCGVVFSELEGPAPQADASAHPDPALQPEAPSGEPASESEAAAAIGTEAMEAVEAVDTIDAIEVIEVIEAAKHGWCPPDSHVYDRDLAEKAWGEFLTLLKSSLG